MLETGRGKNPMADIPREIRSQIRSLVSKTSDETIDLVVNLTGKYIGTEKRKELKKKAEIEIGTEIEKAITETYQTAIRIEEEFRKGKLKTVSPKEKFYSLTDAYFKPFMSEVPKNVHVMDDLFQVCEELKNLRFNWHYLRDTEYKKYLQGLEMLLGELRKTHKTEKAWEALNEFLHSKDFYPLLQATLQRVIKHYEFLGRSFSKIEKRQLDKYMEIYEELSGIYEKFISLIVVLIQLLQIDNGYGYEVARRNGLFSNSQLVEKSGWGIFVSGFDRNIRNALAHKTYKVDILKRTVEFVDMNKAFTLTFREVRKKTRELGTLLLILPHVFISVFCLLVQSIKDIVGSLTE